MHLSTLINTVDTVLLYRLRLFLLSPNLLLSQLLLLLPFTLVLLLFVFRFLRWKHLLRNVMAADLFPMV